jgi:hypothetical protein
VQEIIKVKRMAKQISLFQLVPYILIGLGLVGMAVQGGMFPPASVISVSSVNIDAQGAQIGDYVNNDYRKLTNGYWVISLTVNSYQSIYSIKFGPQNVTGATLNGQKVIANRVVQFNIDPLTPYLLTDLVKKTNVPYTPSASGFQITTFPVFIDAPQQGQNPIQVDPSLVNYFVPKQLSFATVHIPFKIDVLVAGGQAGSVTTDKQGTGTQTFSISPSGNADAYQIQTAYGTAVLNFLGYLSSPITLPYGLDRLTFLPYGTTKSLTDSTGQKYLVILDAENRIIYAPGKSDCYGYYFFRGTTSWTSVANNLAGFPVGLTSAPGWGYTEARSISGVAWYSLWPLKANLTGVDPVGGYYYTLQPGWFGDYIKQVTNPRKGLLDWLVDVDPNKVIDNWPMMQNVAYFQSWQVKNPDANNPQFYAQLPENIFTPVITIRIPFEMADTLVYSPKITTFRIDSVDLSASSLRAGEEGTLKVKITNTGNVRGTANIKVVPDANLNAFPLANQLTLDPNQQGEVTFLIRTGSISSDVASTGKVEVYNMDGVLTDSRSFSILLKPLLSRMYISAIQLEPNRLGPGESAKLTVKVTNQGGGGSARATVKIVTDNFLVAGVKEKSADISPGVEHPFEFSLTAGTVAGVSNLKVELYDQDGRLLESQSISVVITTEPPIIPPVDGHVIVDWWVWLLLGGVGIAAISVGAYLKMNSLVWLGFGLIVGAVIGYIAQPILLSSIQLFGYTIPISGIMVAAGLAMLILPSKTFKQILRVKR